MKAKEEIERKVGTMKIGCDLCDAQVNFANNSEQLVVSCTKCGGARIIKWQEEGRQMTDLEFTKIYLEGEPFLIKLILEIARARLGDGISVIDLHPKLEEEK